MFANVATDENKNDVQMTTFIRLCDDLDDIFGIGAPKLIVTSENNKELAVHVESVNLTYGKGKSAVYGLNGISLHVQQGTIYGLLGPSGCGKTSLLRCILGCAKPESGRIRVFGLKPGQPGSDIPGPGVGYMPQDIALHDDLTIKEMLTYFGKLAFMNNKDLRQTIVYLVTVLALPDANQIVATLSGGQKRRASFACALIHKPKLLILDEPTVGVDPILREKIWDMLVELTEQENRTVIITTHYIEETKRSHTVGFMRRGRLLAEDSPENMLTRYHCETLEEVFYYLCVRQKKASQMGEKILQRQLSGNRASRHNSVTSITWQRSPRFQFNFNAQKWFSVLLTVLWKITLQSIRQKGMLLIQLILPIMTLTMFCFCIAGVPFDVPIAVVNEESPPYLSEFYLRNIDSHILKVENYSDLKSAKEAVKLTKAWAVLHIRENFSESLIRRFENIDEYDDNLLKQGQMTIHADLTNDVLSITLQRTLEQAFRAFAKEALKELDYNPRLLELPIRAHAIHGEEVKSNFFELKGFIIPGLLVILTYTFGFAGTMLLTMTEKYDKIYDRNKVSGVTSTHIVVGHLISRFMFMSITSLILVFIALVFFKVPAKGSLFWAVILLFLQTIAGLTNGMFISSLCSNFHMAVILANGVLLFIFIISGVLWSVESLPYFLRWFSYVTPTTLPTRSLRSILARGLSITDFVVYEGFFMSIAYSIFFAAASVFLFPH